jgi:hypothetical protein
MLAAMGNVKAAHLLDTDLWSALELEVAVDLEPEGWDAERAANSSLAVPEEQEPRRLPLLP